MGNVFCNVGNEYIRTDNVFYTVANKFCRMGNKFIRIVNEFCKIGNNFSKVNNIFFNMSGILYGGQCPFLIPLNYTYVLIKNNIEILAESNQSIAVRVK